MARWAVWAPGDVPGAEAAIRTLARHGEIVRVKDPAEAGADPLVVLACTEGIPVGPRVVLLPATVENDVAGTDICLGADSAVNAILRAAAAAAGPTILDVPGRLTGYLALMGAAGAGAAGALLVERPFPWDRLKGALAAGARPLLVRAEGAGAGADAAARLGALVGGAVKVVPLGPVEPSIFDLQMAHRMGEAAAEILETGGGGRMIAWRGGNCIPVPLESVAGRRRQVAPEVFEFAKASGVLFE
jgi:6-phosphofructokinase 1